MHTKTRRPAPSQRRPKIGQLPITYIMSTNVVLGQFERHYTCFCSKLLHEPTLTAADGAQFVI
jgi:hypothetical protein